MSNTDLSFTAPTAPVAPTARPIAPGDPRRLLALATELATHRDRWPAEFRFEPDRRWYARLPVGDGYEAWLLTWLPGQHTGLHDHDAAGAFVVADGVLHETTVLPHERGGVRDVVRTLNAGNSRAFGAWHVHDLTNRGPATAVSVHVYTPAIAVVRRYRRAGDQLERIGVERAGANW